MKKLCFLVVALIALSIAFTAEDGIAGRARCYRMLNIDASTAASDTLEVVALNGSGEVAVLMHVTGYTYSGAAASVKFYVSVQDSLYPLQATADAVVADSILIADGYKRGSAANYPLPAGNPILFNVFGEKLYVAYLANGSTAGHVTLDVCVRKLD